MVDINKFNKALSFCHFVLQYDEEEIKRMMRMSDNDKEEFMKWLNDFTSKKVMNIHINE